MHHPLMGVPFTAGREHAPDDQRTGELDMVFRKIEFTQEFLHPQQSQCFQRQALASDGLCVGMYDFVCENGVARIRVFCMDVIALVQESFNDVFDRVPEGFPLLLEGDAGLSFQAGDDLFGKFGPVLFGDVELLAEIE